MKNISFCLFYASVLLLLQSTRAQTLATTIKVQAMDMATAFMKNDFTSFVKFMHPNIMAFAGGKEKMKTISLILHSIIGDLDRSDLNHKLMKLKIYLQHKKERKKFRC